ncbi:unnamed protein product, partial [Polarella glacialis]
AFLLFKTSYLAGRGGSLTCFEAGLDSVPFAEAQMARARRHVPLLKVRVVPSILDFELLAPKSVDLFLSSHVIEHMPDPCWFLDGLKRVLKPGGLVFTEVPDQDPLGDRTFRRAGEIHLVFFNQKTFRNMMVTSGFQLLHIGSYQWGSVVRSLFKWPGPDQG